MARRIHWLQGNKIYEDQNAEKPEKCQLRYHKRVNGWADLREFFRGRSK